MANKTRLNLYRHTYVHMYVPLSENPKQAFLIKGGVRPQLSMENNCFKVLNSV